MAEYASEKAEILCLYSDAKEEKYLFQNDFQECYRFMMPHRVRPGESSSQTRPQDANENFTTLGEEVTTDFASDMADTFTPEHSQWAGIEVATTVDDSIKDDVKDAVDKETNIIFDAITASNFHEACKQGNKDLAVSTFGCAVEPGEPGEPNLCQVIPLTELLILRAPSGGIGTRIWDRKMKARDVKSTFPGLVSKYTKALQAALTDQKSKKKFQVLQGCYRDYSVPAEHAWNLFTMIDGEVCEYARKVGVGAANILICRWDPDPSYAWGIGCGMKALADFRELDETAYLKLKGMARIIDPSVFYDDDQVINLEGGLPNGVAIPRLPGSKIDIVESEHSVDAVLFATKDSVDRIRRIFYLDEPDQPGKTPPTAYQWQDESLRRQRRLGTPASPIWPEFLAEAFMRFRYLLVQKGVLEKNLPVGKAALPVRPMNPLKRAAQQEEAMASERALTTLSGLFGPQTLLMIIDVGKTVHSLIDLSHATGVKLKTADAINAGLQQMQQAEQAAQTAKVAAPAVSALANLQTAGATKTLKSVA